MNTTNVSDRIGEIETRYMLAPRNTPEGKAYWTRGIAEEYRQLLETRQQMEAAPVTLPPAQSAESAS
jgi:hypothetical protein